MVPQEFGPFLTDLRKRKNMTQTQLAVKLNVSTAAVSKWERSLCLPEVSKFEDISKVFGLSLMEVIQCRISDKEEITHKEADNAIEASIIIADYEKNRLKRRFIRAILLIVSGFIICDIGFIISKKVSSSGIIGQADALTNIYIESTSPNMLSMSILVIGTVLVTVGGFLFVRLFRENVRKKDEE